MKTSEIGGLNFLNSFSISHKISLTFFLKSSLNFPNPSNRAPLPTLYLMGLLPLFCNDRFSLSKGFFR